MKVSALAVAGLAAIGEFADLPIRSTAELMQRQRNAASAAPIKIVVVTSGINMPVPQPHMEALNAIRIGHPAVAAANFPPSPFMRFPEHPTPRLLVHAGSGMGCGQHLKSKALTMSNGLRQALGLPPIVASPLRSPPPAHLQEGTLNILPFPHRNAESDDLVRFHVEMMRPMEPHTRPFVHRLHRAVNQLGPWEGRAVAFVLGCGLGVLLRMFFVMTLLVVRRIRGQPTRQIQLLEEPETAYVILPPSYSPEVVDEKTVLLVTQEPAPEYEEDVKEVQAS